MTRTLMTSSSQRANLLFIGLLWRSPLVENGGDGPVDPTVRGEEPDPLLTRGSFSQPDLRPGHPQINRKSPLCCAHAVPIYLAGLRRSLARYYSLDITR